MPSLQDPLLIVTDLDGSLLDHHTYSWQPAARWLDILKANAVPVVICSSKTTSEIIALQSVLGLEGAPFIAENGALLHVDARWEQNADYPRKILGQDYATLRAVMERLRAKHSFKFFGFADVSEKQVAEWTGLTPADALLAKRREASEAFIWRDSDERLQTFADLLALEGLAITQGGRFYHVMSRESGKGAAVAWLLAQYQRQDGQQRLSIGLGDGPNDVSMLEAVDFAVVIRGYSKTAVTLPGKLSNVYHSQAFGPEGWSEGLDHFITSV